MKLKKSLYNLLLDINDNTYLYNTLSNGILKIKTNLKKELNDELWWILNIN